MKHKNKFKNISIVIYLIVFTLSGCQSTLALDNEKLLSVVTCNLSLTTGDSPEGTIVSLAGQEDPFNFYSIIVPQSGTAVFQDVLEGNYILKAHKAGYSDYQLLTGIYSNETFNIVLQELKYKPLNLKVDSLSLIASWDAPRDILVNENFEGGNFPPEGWQVITENFTGWYATLDGSSEDFIIPLHSTYAVVNDDADNGNGCCDYLITPGMNLTNMPSYKLNFASFFSGTYSQQAFIEISTDGGNTWMMIQMLSPFPYGWHDVEIDLSQYAGQNGLENVLLAFHADDQGVWGSGWAVDDIVISSETIPVTTYALFMDEVFITTTNDTTFAFQNLVYGEEYLTGVAALYSSGYSEQDTFRFVNGFLSPPLNFEGTIPFNTDYAHLSWEQPYNFADPGSTVPGLMGYNIYRNDDSVAYSEFPETDYFDLELLPGFYKYYITAVYDLTDYGFPGETGESVRTDPVDLSLICCNNLPFTETFNTGLFETNQWTVDPGNWRIAGDAGNEAPSAEFYYSPEVQNYNQSLTSFFIIGTDITDGFIFLDFDLKHTLVNPTGNEFLAVEIYDGSSWIKIKEFNNVSNFDWEHKKIAITQYALGNIFNIRFSAYGINSMDITNWMIDNIHVYRECSAPVDLQAFVNFPHNFDVVLLWEPPMAYPPGTWLSWDNGVNNDAIGLASHPTFSVASRFTSDQLEQVEGFNLTRIRFFPSSPGGTIMLKVWRNVYPTELIYSQLLSDYIPGEWNEILLDTPVSFDSQQELWIGYTVSSAAGINIAGCDAGPAIAGFGDLISIYEGDWESLATGFGYDCNWNIRGYFESSDGQTDLLPIVDNTADRADSQQVESNLLPSPTASVNNLPVETRRDLIGYNIWKNGLFLANTTDTIYYDDAMQMGDQPCYTVTAVYEDCESDHSNQACIYIDNVLNVKGSEIIVYPNPSNDVVNISLTSDISQIVVYNYVGQVFFEQIITKDKNIQLNVRNYESGAYLVKFITNSGESFTKKVAVAH